MKKTILYFTILIFLPSELFAQSDTAFSSFTDEFYLFKTSITEEYNSFEKEINAEFLKFLYTAWEEFDVYYKPLPSKDKPVQQPIYIPPIDSIVNKIKFVPKKTDSTAEKSGETFELNKFKAPGYESKSEKLYFNFYGRKDSIIYHPELLPLPLTGISKNSIALFYKKLTADQSVWEYNIQQLQKHKSTYKYNDWGYAQLLELVAKQFYEQKSDQAIFMHYMLRNSGYHARIGFNKNEIYLLIPSYHDLYDFHACTINNISYYLITDNDHVESIESYSDESHIQLSNFSFELPYCPIFPNAEKIKREIRYNGNNFSFAFNKNKVKFLREYPQCKLELYFDMKLSESTQQVLDSYFNPLFADKKELDKVNILLDFVQNAIPYKTDEDQFGNERYMFAEECLIFPYTDCEDRSILMKQLVKHYTSCSIVALTFPNHCTLAVELDKSTGRFISCKERKFFFCDPTYINAETGMLPDNLIDQPAKIIGMWEGNSILSSR